MATIREQLEAQARAIEAEWALSPPIHGRPREAEVTLRFDSPTIASRPIHEALGKVNSAEVCGVPAGRLLVMRAETARFWSPASGWPMLADAVVRVSYREADWNTFVDRATGLLATPVDSAGNRPYPATDFEGLFDALQLPGIAASVPAEPPSDPPDGSWRDRPALL